VIELHPIPPSRDRVQQHIELARISQRLFCAVGAIAGIFQTRDNEPSLIESVATASACIAQRST
jgi:hypothetical protein